MSKAPALEIVGFDRTFLREANSFPDPVASCIALLRNSSEFQNICIGHCISKKEIERMGAMVWEFIAGESTFLQLDTAFPFEQYGTTLSGDTLAHVFSSELLSEIEFSDNELVGKMSTWFYSYLFRYRYCCNRNVFLSGGYGLRLAEAIAEGTPNLPLNRVSVLRELSVVLKLLE